jgi:CRP-like cAMP-binding protein
MNEHPLDGRIEHLSLMLDLDEEVQRQFIAALKDVGRIAAVNSGCTLFDEGDSDSDDGYVVLRGSLLIESSSGFNNTLFAPVLVGEMKQFAFGDDEARRASVTAAADLEVMAFEWPKLYAALEKSLEAEQLNAFKEALRRYAWMHYLELEGEL